MTSISDTTSTTIISNDILVKKIKVPLLNELFSNISTSSQEFPVGNFLISIKEMGLQNHIYFNKNKDLLYIINLSIEPEDDINEIIFGNSNHNIDWRINFNILIKNIDAEHCFLGINMSQSKNSIKLKNIKLSTLEIYGADVREKLWISSCEINIAKLGGKIDEIIIDKKSTFNDSLTIPNTTGSLQISSTDINNFIITGNLSEFSPTLLHFSQNSHIEQNAYLKYKLFRRISLRSGDMAQAHIFYVKELEEFSQSKDLDWETWFLLKLNYYTSNHGLSFLLPVFWLSVISFVSIVVIVWWELGISDIAMNWGKIIGYTFHINPVDSFLDSPYFKSPNGFGGVSIFFDSIRRISILIFSYLIVKSALRFRFKA